MTDRLNGLAIIFHEARRPEEVEALRATLASLIGVVSVDPIVSESPAMDDIAQARARSELELAILKLLRGKP